MGYADPHCSNLSTDAMLTVLGGLAEFERHLIIARTTEFRQRAQQRGVRFGRKPKLTAHQQQEPWRESTAQQLRLLRDIRRRIKPQDWHL